MGSFSDAVTRPMESDDWIMTVLIGGVLMFLGFLIVPLFLVYGYVVGIIRDRLAGDDELPSFGNWATLFVEGLQAWLIGLIYMIVPLIVGGATVGGAVLAMATGSEAGAAMGFTTMFIGLGLTALLALVFGYVAVAAVVNFAREERFGAAFDFGELKPIVLHRDFAIAWLAAVAVFIVASIIYSIPVIGWLLAPFVSFYAALIAADLWAGGFSRARSDVATTDATSGAGHSS